MDLGRAGGERALVCRVHVVDEQAEPDAAARPGRLLERDQEEPLAAVGAELQRGDALVEDDVERLGVEGRGRAEVVDP